MVIKNLRPVTFRYKGTENRSMGFIAQEITNEIPDSVTEQNEILSVSYDKIDPIIIDTLRFQEEKIKELEALVREKHERV